MPVPWSMVVPVTVPFADTVNLVIGVAVIRFWRVVDMPARLRSAQAVTSRPWVACLILMVMTSSTVAPERLSGAGVWVYPNSATTLTVSPSPNTKSGFL